VDEDRINRADTAHPERKCAFDCVITTRTQSNQDHISRIVWRDRRGNFEHIVQSLGCMRLVNRTARPRWAVAQPAQIATDRAQSMFGPPTGEVDPHPSRASMVDEARVEKDRSRPRRTSARLRAGLRQDSEEPVRTQRGNPFNEGSRGTVQDDLVATRHRYSDAFALQSVIEPSGHRFDFGLGNTSGVWLHVDELLLAMNYPALSVTILNETIQRSRPWRPGFSGQNEHAFGQLALKGGEI
jgi:hypothetical protein